MRKNFLTTTLLTFLAIQINAQGTWIQRANLTGTARQAASTFSCSNKGYICLGTSASGSPTYDDLWEYDPVNNVWTQKANFPGTARYGAMSFSIGTKGYVGCGSSGTADFYEYNSTSNIWTQKAFFPGPARYLGVGISIGTKGYMGLGDFGGGSYTSDWYEYNPGTDSWSAKAVYGGGQVREAFGFGIGSLGYVGGGHSASLGGLNTFYEYNPGIDSWTQRANCGGGVTIAGAAVASATNGYVGCGSTAPGHSGLQFDFWEYTPGTNTWLQKANFPGSARDYASSFYADGKVHIGLGYTSSGVINDLYSWSEYPINTNTLSSSSYCAGTTFNVSYSANITFNAGNVFTAYLSDAAGSFTSEVAIGNVTSTTSGLVTVTIPPGTVYGTGYRIRVKGSNPVSTGADNQANFTINALPNVTLSPYSNVCIGDAAFTLSGGSPGPGTYSVNATPTTVFSPSLYGAGTFPITYSYSDGTCSNTAVQNITVLPAPSGAGAISGPTNPCAGSTSQTYSVAPITNATSYVWNLPSGVSITSGAGTNVITVDIAANASSGNFSVYGSSACGNGSSSSQFVSINPLPVLPTAINGPQNVCEGQVNVNYFVSAIANATGYNWTLPAGASITAGNNTTSIMVSFALGASSGNVLVTGTNGCGNGPASTPYSVTVNALPVVNANSNSPVCENTSLNLSSAAANTYAWSGPASFNSSQQNPSISNASLNAAGIYTLSITNAAGCQNTGTISVTVNPLPSAAGSISGLTNTQICPLSTGITYSVSPINNASGYNWSLPAGASITSGNGTNIITVDYSTGTQSGSLSVNGQNSCGNGTSSSLNINFQNVPVPQICMVTVDSLGNYNEIFWDKTGFASSDTFLVYRDTANNAYGLIGSVPFDSLSMFTDTLRNLYAANGDPNVSSWRYKIAAKDNCGNISQMSAYHQTMHFQDLGLGNFQWTEYKIEGQGTPIAGLSFYKVKMDTFASTTPGNWGLIQTLSASSTTYTYPSYSTYQPTADWRVETNWTITCTPTARYNNPVGTLAAIQKSRSNINNNRAPTTGIQDQNNFNFNLYPNPAKNEFFIQLGNVKGNVQIEIFDVTGRVAQRQTTNDKPTTINCSTLNSGVYFVNIINGEKRIVKKIVIEK